MSLEAYSILKNGNEKLSEHFKVREFYCRDGSDPVFIDTALVEVLEKIRVHFGEAVYTVKAGESFYYRTTQVHRIENPSAKPAKFLWISTPPEF